jgi:hypothetical protein
MDVEAIYTLGELMVRITGPLTLVIIAIIHVSVYMRTRKFPSPQQAIFEYARINLAQRNHAGVLVYGFIISLLFFLVGLGIIVYARLAAG